MTRVTEMSLTCHSPWITQHDELGCALIGDHTDAIAVKEGTDEKGGWNHAWQELLLQAGGVYGVSVLFYALNTSCVHSNCAPALNICPGGYVDQWYAESACYVKIGAQKFAEWERVTAQFTPVANQVTLYLRAAAVRNLTVRLIRDIVTSAKYAVPLNVSIGCLLSAGPIACSQRERQHSCTARTGAAQSARAHMCAQNMHTHTWLDRIPCVRVPCCFMHLARCVQPITRHYVR